MRETLSKTAFAEAVEKSTQHTQRSGHVGCLTMGEVSLMRTVAFQLFS